MRAIGIGLVLAFLGGHAESGVQRCNTRCQRQQTDCVLACDGDLECAGRCDDAAQSCVEACLKPPPPPKS